MPAGHARSGPGGGAARGLPAGLGVPAQTPASPSPPTPPAAVVAESPDARLAGRIARRMAAEGMIAPGDEGAVRDALAAGRLSKAEWRQWAEGGGGATGG